MNVTRDPATVNVAPRWWPVMSQPQFSSTAGFPNTASQKLAAPMLSTMALPVLRVASSVSTAACMSCSN